jgi:hypothetical protein
MYIVKNRDTVESWAVYSETIGNAKRLGLDSSGAETATNNWNSTSPTANVFTVYGGETRVNDSGDDYIAYCWHSVEGYSKIGSYTGNNSTDGPFIYTGFKPAFVMVKRTNSGENWAITDSARSPDNVADAYLRADESTVESTYSAKMDLLSNGFKLRGADTKSNGDDDTYIYMAFAERPFKYARAR